VKDGTQMTLIERMITNFFSWWLLAGGLNGTQMTLIERMITNFF